jgi:hypothetical protein
MKTAFLTMSSLFAATITHAAIVKVAVRNDDDTLVTDSSGAPLTGGDPLIKGDGSAVQIGYYDQASAANPFLGKWIPLTGDESNNGWFFTIGDDPLTPDGGIFTEVLFQGGSIHGFDFPPSTSIPLAVRFYDHFSIFGAQHFNTVSNTSGAWNWTEQDQAHITLSFSDAANPALAWEGGPGSERRTTIPIGVPEPSAALLATICISATLQGARPRHSRSGQSQRKTW